MANARSLGYPNRQLLMRPLHASMSPYQVRYRTCHQRVRVIFWCTLHSLKRPRAANRVQNTFKE